jgi:hypothetical protein
VNALVLNREVDTFVGDDSPKTFGDIFQFDHITPSRGGAIC